LSYGYALDAFEHYGVQMHPDKNHYRSCLNYGEYSVERDRYRKTGINSTNST